MSIQNKAGLVAAIAAFAVLVTIANIKLSEDYGWAVFLATPVAMGLLAGLFAPKAGARDFRDVFGVAFLAVMGAGALFLVVGLEGLICLAMATVIAAPLALLGAWIGYSISRLSRRSNGLIVPALLLSPLVMTGELAIHPNPELESVKSQVEIAAPPEKVWQNVIQFSDLKEPDEWIFRAGIAYPKRARIVGSGPGAIRYCEFSTGVFVEPIEKWDEPRELSFSVSQSPDPLRELSPYDIHPPHLHGYFESRHGQFLLAVLPNGHTLLTGTTWYEQRLWPQVYWRLWSDEIVHRIHMRVLNHIKALSES